jgi:hypothetical protein
MFTRRCQWNITTRAKRRAACVARDESQCNLTHEARLTRRLSSYEIRRDKRCKKTRLRSACDFVGRSRRFSTRQFMIFFVGEATLRYFTVYVSVYLRASNFLEIQSPSLREPVFRAGFRTSIKKYGCKDGIYKSVTRSNPTWLPQAYK